MSDEAVFQEIASQITDVLNKALDARNKQVAETAVQTYTAWEENAFPMWLTALAIELADETKAESNSRELAGILLRGCLVGKESDRKDIVEKRWASVPVPARQEIKRRLWATMEVPETKIRHRAAEAVAQIAILDLPVNGWPDVVQQLAQGVDSEKTGDFFKEACLIALGEICVAAAPKHVQPHSFKILLAIMAALSSPHVELQKVALVALANALQFSDENFKEESQRTPIVNQVMSMTTSTSDEVRLAAYECLVNIAEAYYSYLPDYMKGGLLDTTLNAITTDPNEDIVMQAIEFWSTIAEEETNIMRDNMAAIDTNMPQLPLHMFIKGAIERLAQPLFRSLTRGDLDPDMAAWTIASAASACIALMATALGNEVVPYFVGMVSETVNSPDEREREASVLCFSSILDGPSTAEIGVVVSEALPVFFERLIDESPVVRRTTAFCLARLAQLHPVSIEPQLGLFLQAVCTGLSDTNETTTIASCCADAIDKLAQHIPEEEREKSPLNPYLGDVFNALVAAEATPAAENDPSLHYNIFSAIRSLVYATPNDQMNWIHETFNTFVPRLKASIGSATDFELQGELIGIALACTRRLGEEIEPMADELMSIYIALLRDRDGVGSIYEEVFMATGALVSSIGGAWIKYMPAFEEFLNIGLQVWHDPALCLETLNLITSLCYNLGEGFTPYCKDTITILLEHLNRPELSKSLIPHILGLFADLAYVLGPAFSEFVNSIMDVVSNYLQEACSKTERLSDWEAIDEINQLRQAILTVYTLVLQSCADEYQNALAPHLNSMTRLLTAIAEDRTREDAVNRFACGLISDIAGYFPTRADTLRKYDGFLDYCQRSNQSDERTRVAAQNAIERLNR